MAEKLDINRRNNMKISCGLDEFLSTLEEYRNKGIEKVGIEIDSEVDGLKIVPISNLDLSPKIIGKIVEK